MLLYLLQLLETNIVTELIPHTAAIKPQNEKCTGEEADPSYQILSICNQVIE